MRRESQHLEHRVVIIPLFMLIAFLTRIGADLSLRVTAAPEEAGFLRRATAQDWANDGGHRAGGGRGGHRPIDTRDYASPRRRAAPAATDSRGPSPPPPPTTTTTKPRSSAAGSMMMRLAVMGARKEARARMAAVESGRVDSIVRRYRFINRCTGKHLRIYGSRVDGLGEADDIYGELQVESRSTDGGQLTIQGIPSKSYLCFNKMGKLVVKHSARNRLCLFDELYSSDHYSEFVSAANRTWAVGFGKKTGQRLHGDQWTRSEKGRKCFQFLKTDSDGGYDGREAGPGSGPRPGGRVGPGHRLVHRGGVRRQRSLLKT